jgi:hypothetical protein
MKNRYAVNNGIITGIDSAFIYPEFYETDDNIQCFNDDGVPQYKIAKGKHVLRTQSEIESDPIYIEKYNAGIKKKLDEIDLKSVRSMREYIASKSDAPKFIKDHEAEAKAERDKLK